LSSRLEEFLGAVVVNADCTLVFSASLSSYNESVTSRTDDGVVFVNLSDVNLEFVDGSSAQRNLSFLLQQPLILRHLGQSFFSLLTGKFHRFAKLKVEDLQGGEGAGFRSDDLLYDFLVEFELGGSVVRRELVQRMLRLIHQRVIIRPVHFADAFLDLHIVGLQRSIDSRDDICHVCCEVGLNAVSPHDVIDDFLHHAPRHDPVGHDGLKELLVGSLKRGHLDFISQPHSLIRFSTGV